MSSDQLKTCNQSQNILSTEVSLYKQQQIYNDFKLSIRNFDIVKVRELLQQYQNEFNLVNKIDPQTRQISSYLASVIPDEDQALQMLTLLSEFGVNLEFTDQMKQSILFYISRENKTKLLSYLKDKGFDFNASDLYGQTSVYYAARENKLDSAKKLIELGCNINHIDALLGQTALFYAAREGHKEMCKLLLDNGVNVNHQDSQKKNALYYAKQQNRKDVVELLITHINSLKIVKMDVKNDTKRPYPKKTYELIYKDEHGRSNQLTKQQFDKFKRDYPEVANLLLNADEMIDAEMLRKLKEGDQWTNGAKKIINHLWKQQGAYLFHQPVDPKKYRISDYFEIIKKPMDLGTIRNKLNSNHYANCEAFVDDVEQVFYNCATYNGTESEVGNIGLKMLYEFNQQKCLLSIQKY